jgi:hypothetical protein
MPIVHAPVQLTVEHLLAAVKQMPPADLHDFARKFAKWQKSKGTRMHEEAKLLACIKENSRLSAADQRRYERLRRKRERMDLTESEFAEYQSLIQQLEARNVKRLEALLALAQKRGTTLRGLMKELSLPGIKDAA